MVLLEASKLTLPNPSSLSSSHSSTSSSILFEPSSLSLAITHSNSSISLYPSFSPLSSNLQFPQTLIPKPTSSSTFLILQKSPISTNPNSDNSVVFIVCGPHKAGSQILLRFYHLNGKSNVFSRVNRISCGSRSGFVRFEPELGVLMNVKHGVSVKVVGSVNYFAVYSVSSLKVWVFAVKMTEGDDGGSGGGLSLMKCAVIRCSRPVWSLSISFGFLILGEENGVRVFGLRRLVKGKMVVRRVGHSNSKSSLKQLSNGDHHGRSGGDRGCKSRGGNGVLDATCNGGLEGKIEKHGVAAKQTNVKSKNDNKDGGACFLALKGNEIETKSTSKVSRSVKAISIQALSQKMFLILDSHGDLHLLCLHNSGFGIDITGNVRQLPRVMNVQCLAVHPDISTTSQTIWLSDGCHSVHMLTTTDMENGLNEADGNDGDEKLMRFPVTQVLFSSEKIQDIIPISSNSILIHGQGSLYAYAIS
ncbi:uncharacterized protein LOC123910945 isoform X1 [Trifolium pratense]|uniref:uncharacterized protein LOC123910945 isoform X1 n=1 Tax=Trifolium pratense TaxID=57577 RepID=UPI001E691139|nr:uncharacterized protein LOC123910945 isoform X1 [Trifolium pratense]